MTGNLDLSYIYPFQQSRYRHFWQQPLPKKENLEVETVRGGYALPPIKRANSKRWMGYGGLVDADGRPVKASGMYGPDKFQLMGMSYQFDKNTCSRLEGEYIYLGLFIKHWGHFIIDSSTRLYYAIQNPGIKCFFLLQNGQNIDPCQPQIARALELLDLTQRTIFINCPTQIEYVIVPMQSYVRESYFSDQYIKTFTTIANNIQPDASSACDSIFFSRSKFNKMRCCEVGVEFLDMIFDCQSYKIIYPEFESLDNQIYYIMNCNNFASEVGSIVHNLMFAPRPVRTYIVNKSSYINVNDMDTCKIKDIAPVYLDFYIAKYPANHYWGPFFIWYNEIMDKYMTDNGLCKSEMLSYKNANMSDLFYEYNCLYSKLWPNPHVKIEADASPMSANYHHPNLLTDWAIKYSGCEHRAYLQKQADAIKRQCAPPGDFEENSART